MIGELDKNTLEALLETIPVEFSVIDKNDKVLAWNKHETRIFRRPTGAVGRNVRDCHPKGSLNKVETILEEMKAGKRDKARFWIDLPLKDKDVPQKIMIEYYALRDAAGNYLGCLEASQNITDIQKITGQKRLLD
ncbi:MAG TPA: PAS domain-containing protein [Smithellaceae bacterium]|nr:PAS domain-containing protein [Smithellaceae bacterium]HOM70069.1 PAS domain-containing protein [Smithellaceae bacterium]